METRSANDGEDDFVEQLFSAQAHDYLMFFTNTGRVYVERVYEIPEGSRTSKGRNIKNVINLDADESVAAVLRLERSLDEDGNDNTFGEHSGFVLFATRSGKVKKSPLNAFKNYRKDGIIAIKLEEGNHLIDVRRTSGTDEVVLVTRNGLSLRFNEENARPMGRNTAGVTGIKPQEGDYVVGMAIVDPEGRLLVASENGLGKRTPFDDYRLQSRGGKGIITMKCTEKTGLVTGGLMVHEDDELMLMTSSGQSIRIRVSEVRETGRNAQGVKLLTLKDGETLMDIAKVIPDDEDAVDNSEEENESADADEATSEESVDDSE